MSEIRLSKHLTEGNERAAAEVLRRYYKPLQYPAELRQSTKQGTRKGFTGGLWDTFDPSGTRTTSPFLFTADDLLATSLLSAPIGNWAACELLIHRTSRFTDLLKGLKGYLDTDFVNLEDVGRSGFPEGYELWDALTAIPGIGPTRASKLMARKFPRLFPISDEVINQTVLGGTGRLWVPLHEALNTDGQKLHRRLICIRDHAALTFELSPLRVFDVLAWMDGTGQS